MSSKGAKYIVLPVYVIGVALVLAFLLTSGLILACVTIYRHEESIAEFKQVIKEIQAACRVNKKLYVHANDKPEASQNKAGEFNELRGRDELAAAVEDQSEQRSKRHLDIAKPLEKLTDTFRKNKQKRKERKGCKCRKGKRGAKGDKGDIGPPSLRGPPGFEGARGPAGPRGFEGARGPEGPRGSDGARGPEGPRGSDGARGLPGQQGYQGEEGKNGDKGDKGDSGPRGPKGDIGLPGSKGSKGDTGVLGARGPKGDTGVLGAKGPKGDIGLPGSKGLKGDTGVLGAKGPKGDKGEAGSTAMLAQSAHIVAKGNKVITTQPKSKAHKFMYWAEKHASGNMTYKDGCIEVGVTGYYFIYSQMYYAEGVSPYISYSVYIDNERVLRAMHSVIDHTRRYNTQYVSGIFKIASGQKIWIGTRTSRGFHFDESSSFFGTFLLHY